MLEIMMLTTMVVIFILYIWVSSLMRNISKAVKNGKSLSDNKKDTYYKQFRRFYISVSYLAKKIISEFLKIAYVPTIRQPLKQFFLLSNGEFNNLDNVEYYGLLKDLENNRYLSRLSNDNPFEDYYNICVIIFCITNDIALEYLCEFDILKRELK